METEVQRRGTHVQIPTRVNCDKSKRYEGFAHPRYGSLTWVSLIWVSSALTALRGYLLETNSIAREYHRVGKEHLHHSRSLWATSRYQPISWTGNRKPRHVPTSCHLPSSMAMTSENVVGDTLIQKWKYNQFTFLPQLCQEQNVGTWMYSARVMGISKLHACAKYLNVSFFIIISGSWLQCSPAVARLSVLGDTTMWNWERNWALPQVTSQSLHWIYSCTLLSRRRSDLSSLGQRPAAAFSDSDNRSNGQVGPSASPTRFPLILGQRGVCFFIRKLPLEFVCSQIPDPKSKTTWIYIVKLTSQVSNSPWNTLCSTVSLEGDIPGPNQPEIILWTALETTVPKLFFNF